MRNIVGKFELDELLAKRDEASREIKAIVDEKSDSRGIDVLSVEIKDINIPDDLKRTIGKQAEAEREKREERLEKIYRDVCRQLFESKDRAFAKKTARGYLEDILSVMQYIDEEKNSIKRDIALDLLEEKIEKYQKIIEGA
jgi:regulator of protease activity HflC (stomatin/prohibitin superfamily)